MVFIRSNIKKNTQKSILSNFKKSALSLLPLKILGDGSNNLILEKNLNGGVISGVWTVNDVPFTDSSITNLILQSDNVLSSTWVATGTKTQNGTVKSPMGDSDVPLLDLTQMGTLYQDVTLPAGTYTQSFYHYTTHQQIVGARVPNNNSQFSWLCNFIDVSTTNRWQKYSYTFTLSSTTTIRTVIETQQYGGFSRQEKPAISGLGAFTGFQIEAGSVARTRVLTTTATATRASGVASGACFGVLSEDIGKTIKFVPRQSAYQVASKKFIGNFFITNLGQSKSFYAWKQDRTINFLSPRLKQFGRRWGYYGASVAQSLENIVTAFDNPGHWHETLSANIPTNPDPLTFDRFDCSYSSFGLSQFCDSIDLELVLFPENRGGTGFTDSAIGSWKYDGSGTLYNSMITRINNYIGQYPNAKCIGIISDLQEKDIADNMTWNAFKSYLMGLYFDIRNKPWSLNANIPIFHVPFSATWTGGDSALKTQYYNGLRALGGEVSNYYCVDTLAQASGVNVYRSNGEVFGGSTPDFTHLSIEAGLKIKDEMNTFFKATYPNNNIPLPPPNLPVNIALPTITGIEVVGEVLTSTQGSWAGGVSYSYQWRRNNVNILGATSNTYTIVSGDIGTRLTCVVTATNIAGSASATSSSITVYTVYNYDAFNDVNGTSILAHTGNINATWSQQSGATATNAEIQNNRIVIRSTNNIFRFNAQPPTANYKVKAEFICISELTNDNTGIIIRGDMTGVATSYFTRFSRASNNWALFKSVAGTVTQIGSSYADTLPTGSKRVVELIANNDNISVVINGVTVINVTDNSITQIGAAGFRGNVNSQSATTGLQLEYIITTALT